MFTQLTQYHNNLHIDDDDDELMMMMMMTFSKPNPKLS